MPHLKISTNVSKSSIPGNFLKETSSLIAKLLGKPENVSFQIFEKTWFNFIYFFVYSIV